MLEQMFDDVFDLFVAKDTMILYMCTCMFLFQKMSTHAFKYVHRNTHRIIMDPIETLIIIILILT